MHELLIEQRRASTTALEPVRRDDDLHHAHAGGRRPRRVSVRARGASSVGRLGPVSDDRARFLALGEHDRTQFNMTALALRDIGWVNGVSKLHGEVTAQDVDAAAGGPQRQPARADEPSPTACTSHVVVARDHPAVRTHLGRTGPTAATIRRSGTASATCPTASSGSAGMTLKRLSVRLHPAARARSLGQENVSARRWWPPVRCSTPMR